MTSLLIYPEYIATNFNILKSGCTSWAKIKIGEIKLLSGNCDTTLSGQNLDEWKVENNNLDFSVEEKLLHKIPYKKPLGKLKQLQVLFKGNGSIDYFKIYSNKGKLLFSDVFEKKQWNTLIKNWNVQKDY